MTRCRWSRCSGGSMAVSWSLKGSSSRCWSIRSLTSSRPASGNRKARERPGHRVARGEGVGVGVDGARLVVPGDHVDALLRFPLHRALGAQPVEVRVGVGDQLVAAEEVDGGVVDHRAVGHAVPSGRWLIGDEGGEAMVEPPGAAVVVEDVVVAAHQLDRPAGVPQQQEDHVADGRGLGVVPLGDDGVEDEVALGPLRLPLRSRPARRASWPRWVPRPGISQTPSGQKVATTSSVRPSSRAWV